MTPHGSWSFAACSAALWLAALATATQGAEPEWYAGIEIGSKGIKVVALPIGENGKPDLNRLVKKLPHSLLNNVTLGDLKDGKFRPEAIEEAQAAVKDFYEQLTSVGDAKRPKLRPENIWIVASSGLVIDKPSNYSALEEAVKAASGGAKTLQAIDQKREVELLMRGAIPTDQWDNSMLVDIGNGNTKFGYLQSARPPQVEQALVPNLALKGTGAYRKAIDLKLKAEKNVGDFHRFCAIILEGRKQLMEDVDEQVGRKPGLRNSKRTRVYLSGGSPYVITSLLYPLSMTREDLVEVPVSIKDLRKFEDEILETGKVPSPNLNSLSEADAKRAENQLREVKDIFDDKSVLIGAEILLGFNDVLQWEKDEKELYFTKSGLVAWILGFVVEEKAKGQGGRRARRIIPFK